jgi:two-component system chemotaxis response regulator CheY
MPDFLYFLSTKKKEFRNWYFLGVRISKDSKDLKIAEIGQSVMQYFQGKDAAQLFFEGDSEMVVVTPNVDNLALSMLENSLYEVFSREHVHITYGPLYEHGLQNFCRLLQSKILSDDCASQISLNRASRLVNCMMVMDDDPMILRQMEQALSGFGTVISVRDPEEFLDMYRKHAPDIVFMDIHMPNMRGTNLLETLLGTLDPHAYVVMISSDTMTQTILESKAKGTRGFIMKPLTRDNLYAHVMRSPSFMPKKMH